MRQGSFFSSVLYLFVIIFLAGLGILFVSLRWLDDLCEYFAKLLLYRSESFFPVGLFLICISLLLLLSFYRLFRHKYLSISTKFPSCEVDECILTAYAKKYFQELFNHDFLETEVLIFKRRLEIITYLPKSQNKSKVDLNYYLEKAKKDFSKMLKEKFGYSRKFTLTIKTI